MSVLDVPRHPIVESALRLSRHYCEGQVVDDLPAFVHAMRVARKLVDHVPRASADVVAAALLHDAPLFAPEDADLDAVLTRSVCEGVPVLVRSLVAEHEAMMSGQPPHRPVRAVVLVMSADKIVAFQSLVQRGKRSPDERAFWEQRAALRSLFGYFRQWCELAAPVLPDTLSCELHGAFRRLEDAATRSVAASGPDCQGQW